MEFKSRAQALEFIAHFFAEIIFARTDNYVCGDMPFRVKFFNGDTEVFPVHAFPMWEGGLDDFREHYPDGYAVPNNGYLYRIDYQSMHEAVGFGAEVVVEEGFCVDHLEKAYPDSAGKGADFYWYIEAPSSKYQVVLSDVRITSWKTVVN